jgi:phage terminase small subunit
MQNNSADMKLRMEAAKAIMPFVHNKMTQGKGRLAQETAKKASVGRFFPNAPPIRLVK